MAKLYFRNGAMNSGKTTALMQVAYNYKERGMRVLILKPAIDTLAKSKTTNDALPLLRDLLRHQSPPVVFVTAWTLARLASRSKDPATLDTLAGYLESITDADDDRLDTFFDGRGNVERLQDRACG